MSRGASLAMTIALLLGPTAGGVLGQRGARRANSARDCAVCHVSWVGDFAQPGSVTLIPRPPDSFVADADNCLGCHDGSVGDSRRQVWLEHGHREGTMPPAEMEVPTRLPLADGRLTCRTCHTAHAGGRETLANTVFMRVPNDEGQLCIMCHADKAATSELANHPMQTMEQPLPEELGRHGAYAGSDDRLLTCQTCHEPHGSANNALLVLPAEHNTLCVTCHERLQPQWWQGEGVVHHRPVTLTSDTQRQAIQSLGTRLGADETLICLSCHRMHAHKEGEHLLPEAFDAASDACIRCHPDQGPLTGSSHDLRTSAPQARNLHGETAEQAGVCSACHGGHGWVREYVTTSADPAGTCTTCHQSGECAEGATFTSHDHPLRVKLADLPEGLQRLLHQPDEDGATGTLGCLACHNPHQPEHGKFRRLPPEQLCGQCHVEQHTSLAGAHEFTSEAGATNLRGATVGDAGSCGICHAVHDARGPMLWIATEVAAGQPDDLCLSCHRPDGMAAQMPSHDLRHPSGPATAGAAAELACRLPLYGQNAHRDPSGFVTCMSCHGVHDDSNKTTALLRPGPDGQAETMCFACHHTAETVQASLHSSTFMKPFRETANAPKPAGFCAPCHVVHVRPEVRAEGMWAAPLDESADTADARRCLGCHGPQGKASRVTLTDHPPVVLPNPTTADTEGFLPLIDTGGEVAADGRISCTTCHLPHGRDLAGHTAELSGDPLAAARLRGLRPMVRPYVAPNLCTACHGFDGLRRFLYFHRPEGRGGPLKDDTAAPFTLPQPSP